MKKIILILCLFSFSLLACGERQKKGGGRSDTISYSNEALLSMLPSRDTFNPQGKTYIERFNIIDHFYERARRLRSRMRDYGWEYEIREDALGRRTKIACRRSQNTIRLPFPYEHPNNFATFCVRRNESDRLSVFLYVQEGQITTNSWEPKRVAIRFDSGEIAHVQIYPSESLNSEICFLGRDRWIVEKLLESRTFSIEIPFYNNGREVFTFVTIRPLEWELPNRRRSTRNNPRMPDIGWALIEP